MHKHTHNPCYAQALDDDVSGAISFEELRDGLERITSPPVRISFDDWEHITRGFTSRRAHALVYVSVSVFVCVFVHVCPYIFMSFVLSIRACVFVCVCVCARARTRPRF